MTQQQRAGQCPVCGSPNLEYFSYEQHDDMMEYPWECYDCESEGSEWATIIFDQHIITHNSKDKPHETV